MVLGKVLFILYTLTIISSLFTFTRYKRYALMGELLFFFFGVPVSLTLLFDDLIMVWMVINFCCCCLAIIYLLHNSRQILELAVQWRSQNFLAGWKSFLKSFVIRLVAMLVVLSVIVLYFIPEEFFKLLTDNPLQWLVYFVLYGVLSAFPQEFAYRTFFFSRYHDLFPKKHHMILASSIMFSLAHLIFKNWLCLAITLIAGLLFSVSYTRYKNVLFVSLEHTVYGYLTFTVGFSGFFGGW